MIIEPRLIMHMLAIGKYGSISKAAASLRMSQPALSNGVALLEQRLGVKVLERSRHGSRLTECGLAVVRCADAVDSRINSLLDEIKVRAEGSAGTLKIGVSPVVSYSFVPQAIADLTDQMPRLAMSIREASDDQLTELMTSGKIDLSICPIGVAPQRADVVEERLFTDPFSILVRKGHRLSRTKHVSVRDIIDEQWILPHFGSAKRLQVEAIFLTCGFPVPPNSIITNSTDMIEALLLRTDRIAIVSDWVIRSLDPKKYARIAIQHIGAPRTIGVKRLRNVQPSPATEAFIAILKKQASGLGLPFAAAKNEPRYRAKSKRRQR